MMENETGPALAGARTGELDHADKLICSPNNASSTQRQRLPNRRDGTIVSFEHEGHRYRASVSRFPDGRIAEIFLDATKFGSDTAVNAQDSAILASIAMQHGVSVSTIVNSIRGPISRALTLLEPGA